MDKQTAYGGIKSKPRFKKVDRFKGEKNAKRVNDKKGVSKKSSKGQLKGNKNFGQRKPKDGARKNK